MRQEKVFLKNNNFATKQVKQKMCLEIEFFQETVHLYVQWMLQAFKQDGKYVANICFVPQ